MSQGLESLAAIPRISYFKHYEDRAANKFSFQHCLMQLCKMILKIILSTYTCSATLFLLTTLGIALLFPNKRQTLLCVGLCQWWRGMFINDLKLLCSCLLKDHNFSGLLPVYLRLSLPVNKTSVPPLDINYAFQWCITCLLIHKLHVHNDSFFSDSFLSSVVLSLTERAILPWTKVSISYNGILIIILNPNCSQHNLEFCSYCWDCCRNSYLSQTDTI